MKSHIKIFVISLALAAQAFLGSARAEMAPECKVDSEQITALTANKDNMQGLIDQIRVEEDLEKRYVLIQQHLAAVKSSAEEMDRQYISLVEVCGRMSSPNEDAIIRLLEQRISMLQVVVYQLIQHNEEFESPYKTRGKRPW